MNKKEKNWIQFVNALNGFDIVILFIIAIAVDWKVYWLMDLTHLLIMAKVLSVWLVNNGHDKIVLEWVNKRIEQ